MAKQQSVIDATINLVKGGKDASEVLKCCKSLVKDDLFILVGLLSSLAVENAGRAAAATTLVPKPTVTTAEKEGGPATTTPAEKEDGPAENVDKTEKTVCRFFDFFGEVKEDKKDEKTAQIIPIKIICRRLRDTGVCEQNKNDKSCQDLHPAKCSYYAGFGLARVNPRGCKSNDCKFLHVVICRYKSKALCKKQVCSLQHLQPEAVEKKAKVQPENVHHQPKKAPTTAAFLDQGLDQRMSKIEGLLMMMIQQRGLPPAPSGWPLGTLGEAYSNVSLK
jgi:hypothetical protein